MSFRERLGPRTHIGPVPLGHRLGEEIKVGQNRHFNVDSDQYGSWGYEVRVTKPTHAMVLMHYETGGLPVSTVVGEYERGRINKSVAKGVIRWTRE